MESPRDTPSSASGAAVMGEPDTQFAPRIATLVRRIVRTLFGCSVLVAAVALIAQDEVTLVLGLINAVTFAVLWYVERRGNYLLIPAVSAAVALATSCYAMATGSGLHDVAIVLLPLVVLVGGLVVKRALIAAVAVVTTLAALVTGALQMMGLAGMRPVRLDDPIDMAVVSILVACASAVTYFIVESLTRSLSEAEASERNYREIFDATQDAIVIQDAESGRILEANARMAAMFGYPSDAIRAMSFGQTGVAEDGFSESLAADYLHKAQRVGPQVFEWLARRRDGSQFWVEVTLRQSRIGGHGRVLAVVRDVDRRRRMEHRTRQAEKMQAVGQLAGGVAHDFNNQLAGIVGYAELVRARDSDRLTREYADGILTAAMRASDLTAKLLTFARKDRRLSQVVDCHQLLREVCGLLERSIDRRVALEVELTAGEPWVLGDSSTLQNALLNLALNARDAMAEGGTLGLRTYNEQRSDGSGAFADLIIEVSDTGCGMDRETRERAFEPFYTTKEQGTGMGLAAVYGTVQAHGGAIDVESAPGRGSRFRIRLAARAEGAGRGSVKPAGVPEPLYLRVLVADDEHSVAQATRRMLERLGCQVDSCSDGLEALERFRAQPERFDAAVLDLVMPRLGGADAFGRLREARPGLPIVFVSGFDPDATVERLLSHPCTRFVSKPFRLAEIADALRSVAPEPNAKLKLECEAGGAAPAGALTGC